MIDFDDKEIVYFKIKWGKKYIWPDGNYKQCGYLLKGRKEVIKEIEEEFPRYKGKVKCFKLVMSQII